MLTELTTKYRKAVSALIIGIGIIPGVSVSDIYVWGNVVTNCGDSPDAADVTFTMIDGIGGVALNGGTDEQTPTCGTITYDTEGGSTGIGGGDLQMVGFPFNGFTATPYFATLEKIPAGLDDNVGNLLMGNMLFAWGVTIGIPVSIVWDGQGILNEMDGIPSSFTLDASGNILTANAFSNIGGIPASDALVTSPIGAQPMATTTYNTTNVPACAVPDPGADGIPGTPDDVTDCMDVNPSGDISQPIISDTFGGNPMQDGPFLLFNANFEFNNMKLTSFTDNTSPTLALNGAQGSVINLTEGTSYVEDGASCTDAAPLNTNLNANVIIGGVIPDPLTVAGSPFIVTYDCADPSGNNATQITRTINVTGAGEPVITLQGISPVTHECVTAYSDAGATCNDAEDGVIAVPFTPPQDFSLDATTNLDVSIVGSQFVTWSCTDSDTNTITQDRIVDVGDTINPVVSSYSLPGSGIINASGILILEVNDEPTFAIPTANATDSCDSSVTTATTTSAVNFVIQSGSNVTNSSLLYTAQDTSLNVGTDTLSVQVYRSEPVITLVGDATKVLNVGDTYIEQGADIFDAQDGAISAVTTSGTVTPTSPGTNPASPRDLIVSIDASAVDSSTEGVYEVLYNATDFDGNLAAQVIRIVQVGIFASGSNFTMLDAQGNVFGGTNDVLFDWDQSVNTSVTDLNFNMNITSQQPFPFFGFVWTAHDTRVFGPGTYSFDSGCTTAEIRTTGCAAGSAANSGPAISMTVGVGQVGAHILFDWNTTSNIDVVNVWDIDAVWDQHGDADPKNQLYNGLAGLAPDPATTWKLVSTDVNGDGVNSSPMVDGPFQGFYANFNAGPGATAPPPEPYTGTAPDTKLSAGLSLNIWGLFAGLLTLLGLRRLGK